MSDPAATPSHPTTRSHWRIIDPVRGQVLFAMGLSVLSVACSIAALVLMSLIVRDLLNQQSQHLGGMIAALVGLTVATYLLRGISFKRTHLAVFDLETVLRTRLSEKLAQVSLGFLTDTGSGALTKVLQDDIRELHVFVADSTPLYARAYAAPILTLLVLLWLDWRLALVAAGVLVGGMAILSSAMRDSKVLAAQYNQARERVNAAVIEFVQAMPVVRTFDGGQLSFGRYQRALGDYLEIITSWYRRSGPAARLSMAILNPMPTLLALLWCGAYWWLHESLDFAVWLAVLLVGTGMAEALMPYMALYHLIEKAKVSIARIDELEAAPVLPAAATPQLPQDSSLVFEAVDFRYPNRTENALTEVSFQVAPGSFTALVGGSGAGKTTVARLIPRFWDVTGGCVRVGGIDVREIAPQTLMEQVAFVFQENFLFSDSIAANIRLGLPQASDEEVIAAARAAQAHEFISALPQGYDTLAGERGAALSGGQRQRITIARAILQNRPILVLDEATAFADPENEALLMAALAALMKGKTVLMIAHRLSTIRGADQILVFDHGRLVESGTHDVLVASQGGYARLWRAYETARDWRIGNPESTTAATGAPA